jgi:hypothetical protein
MRRMSGFGSFCGISSRLVGILIAALALGGCNRTTATAPVAPAVPQGPVRPVWPSLPETAACTKELNHYQTVLDADVGTGNLNRSVYEEIEADLSRAASACADGKDGEARAIIHSTKIKHGYRASA